MTEKGFRLRYGDCLALLAQRLTEPRAHPGPMAIQLLTGPRQVGKTTLLLELARRFGSNALYVAADAPEASLPGFWEQFWARAEGLASTSGRAIVLIDEVHLQAEWAARLKAVWDRHHRERMSVDIVATGSSALQLATGSRESLAGRFERITLTHWPAAELAAVFGIPELDAAEMVVRMGAYPGAVERRADSRRWAAYVHDAILEPAIGRDILALASVRKPAMLRQVFAVAAASPAKIVSLQKIQGQLQDRGALQTIAHYLALLEEGYLVSALARFSERELRQRSAPPKLVVLSNGLLAAASSSGAPDPSGDPARFGAWLENACLAHAINAGQTVHYWREEPIEVDAVIDGDWGRWVVEVKSGAITIHDLAGLLEFHRRHPSYRPLIIGTEGARDVARRAGIAMIEWREYLLRGLESIRD